MAEPPLYRNLKVDIPNAITLGTLSETALSHTVAHGLVGWDGYRDFVISWKERIDLTGGLQYMNPPLE